jgi:hypothetical protein
MAQDYTPAGEHKDRYETKCRRWEWLSGDAICPGGFIGIRSGMQIAAWPSRSRCGRTISSTIRFNLGLELAETLEVGIPE